MSEPVVVIGAGIGGLAAAVDLAARGVEVTVLERAATPGGKMREAQVARHAIDVGPTVLTMRAVFDELFDSAGASFERAVRPRRTTVLARHAWGPDQRLDLFTDLERSADAVGELAGAAEARGYRRFCARAEEIFATLERSFLRTPRPSPLGLVHRTGFAHLGALWRIRPFATLWDALGDYFRDPRLRQLFGRYATYVGSSPFLAPATLMLIAHVERAGVWTVDGGMQRIADAMAGLAERLGARVRYGEHVEEIRLTGRRVGGVRLTSGEALAARAVVLNADTAALASGGFGAAAASRGPRGRARPRSLSAITWACLARAHGPPLHHHNVFFSRDYAAEFDDLLVRSRAPRDPTVYVCAQDRGAPDDARRDGAERLFCLINAPATGDTPEVWPASETERCEKATFETLHRCGIQVERVSEVVMTDPVEFHRRFPASGGALYGPACHGWRASFQRPGARTRIPGLYLAGGSAHPGPGVPMTALGGRIAARTLFEDLASTRTSLPTATAGGTSMR